MLRIIFTLVALILTILSSCHCATPPAPAATKVEDAAIKTPASAPASAPVK